MSYTWKQELYISFKPTDNCNALKTQNLQWQVQCVAFALHDDPRTKT